MAAAEFVWLEIRPRCGSMGRASENERFLGVAGGWFRGNKRGANRLSDEAVAPSWSCAAFSFAETSAYPLDKSAEKCRMICIPVVWFLHKGLMAHFTAGEMEVMRILWEHGELKPAEIQEHFPRPIRETPPCDPISQSLSRKAIWRGEARGMRSITAPRQSANRRFARCSAIWSTPSAMARLNPCYVTCWPKKNFRKRNCLNYSDWPRSTRPPPIP